MRDIIRLFSDRESRDELGLGQIRDALSDALFPGTSTLLTRARYLLFVPWAYQKAAGRPNPSADADRAERDVIHALKASGDYAGLLGMQAGEALKNLPSLIYWSMLRHYRILADESLSRADVLRFDGMPTGAADLGVAAPARFSAWSSELPPAPEGFPKTIPDGFRLSADEAGWLRDRILNEAPGTLFAHFAIGQPSRESFAPWADPAIHGLGGDATQVLSDARAFSALMHGAQLIYNLLLAEEYEDAGYDRVTEPASRFREQVAEWGAELPSLVDLNTWNLDGMLARVELVRGTPIHFKTRAFVRDWFSLVQQSNPAALADHEAARSFMERREREHKGAQARIGNRARLASWGGSSGAGALVYRWPQVRGILLDIRDGLQRENGGVDA